MKVKWSVAERNGNPGFGLVRMNAGAVRQVMKGFVNVAELKRLLLEGEQKDA